MMRAASPTGWGLTLYEGTIARNWSPTSISPWLASSSNGMASIGAIDSVTDRGGARLPTTTTTSSSNCSGAGDSSAASCASAGPAACVSRSGACCVSTPAAGRGAADSGSACGSWPACPSRSGAGATRAAAAVSACADTVHSPAPAAGSG